MEENSNRPSLVALLEALFFVSTRPLSLKKIQQSMNDISLESLVDAIDELQKKYEGADSGITLVKVGSGLQFRTKEVMAPYIRDFCKVSSVSLSPTTMEVLAVIVYRGPLPKSQIDKIRGVDSSYILRGLMDKGLIKIVGKSAELGRLPLYGITDKFLEMFNLASLEELPPEKELEELAQKSMDHGDEIKTPSPSSTSYEVDELNELDKIGDEIKKINSETEFTKALKRAKKDPTSPDTFAIMAQHISKKEVEKRDD